MLRISNWAIVFHHVHLPLHCIYADLSTQTNFKQTSNPANLLISPRVAKAVLGNQRRLRLASTWPLWPTARLMIASYALLLSAAGHRPTTHKPLCCQARHGLGSWFVIGRSLNLTRNNQAQGPDQVDLQVCTQYGTDPGHCPQKPHGQGCWRCCDKMSIRHMIIQKRTPREFF